MDDVVESRVWIRDPKLAWVPATVEGREGCTVRLVEESGKREVVFADEEALARNVKARNSGRASEVEDLASLRFVNEPGILHVVRRRFEASKMYTSAGKTVMVATNPYRSVEARGRLSSVAARVLEGSGSVLLSGESGAGKTETARLLLRHLDESTVAEETISLLDCFGNARTARNKNSSRFGKWIVLGFDRGKKMVGASVRTLLLETGRCVRRDAREERGFHVFYEVGSADANLVERSVCSRGGVVDATDEAMFSKRSRVLEKVCDSYRGAWEAVRGLMEVGRVEFGREGEVDPETRSHLVAASRIFGRDLETAFTSSSDGYRARDAFIKTAYEQIFSGLVDACNAKLGSRSSAVDVVGVLDVPGFSRDRHTLDQLLMNFANERLQRYYVECVFEADRREYESEGIEVVEWEEFVGVDATPTLEAFVATLDDDQDGGGGGEMMALSSNEGSGLFCVQHFAGEVEYDLRDDDDSTSERRRRNHPAVAALFPLAVFAAAAAAGQKKQEGTGSRFRIAELFEEIAALASPFFIRCVKPNDAADPSIFDRPRVVEQLRYFGVLEAAKNARAGYAVRLPHAVFVDRYAALAAAPVEDEDDAVDRDARSAAATILEDVSGAALGKTRVFLREEAVDALEERLVVRRSRAAVSISAAARGRAARARFRRIAEAQLVIGKRSRGRAVRRRLGKSSRLHALVRGVLARTAFRRISSAAAKRRSRLLALQSFARMLPAFRFFKTGRVGPLACAVAGGRCAAPVSRVELAARRAAHQAARDAAVERRDFGAASAFQAEATTSANLVARVWAGDRAQELHEALAAEAEAARLELQHDKAAATSSSSLERLDAIVSRADAARLESCPTRAALREAAEAAETDLRAAINRRDFAACARLEPRAKKFKERLASISEDETVEGLSARLEAALGARDFEACARLEADLARAKSLEADRAADPEPKVVAARAKRAAAVAAKDWRAAGRAQAELRKWEPATPPRFSRSRSASSRSASMPPLLSSKAPSVVSDITVDTTAASSKKSTSYRSVARLRPDKPVVASVSATLRRVCSVIAKRRLDCALLTERDKVKGIVTDSDVARAVAGGLDPDTTPASRAMTPDPRCVRASDPALDALKLMIDHKFRHLPVLDDSGDIVGVLRLNKLLHEVIDKIETRDADSTASPLRSVVVVVNSSGSSSSSTVDETRSVREAARLVAATKRAALAIDPLTGDLRGILSAKDILARVVAKGLPLDTTRVADVMTEDPDTIDASATTLDALRMMHDNHYLHLPVVDDKKDKTRSSSGGGGSSILGVVDALQVADAADWGALLLAGGGGGGGDSCSEKSAPSARSTSVASQPQPQKPVEKLRPDRKPLIVATGDPVAAVCEAMAERRTDCALVATADGALVGILTDHDVAKRGVAGFENNIKTRPCDDIMTRHPKCVGLGDGALDALKLMVKDRLRHLAVIEEDGAMAGVLHVNRVLSEAIGRVEKLRSSYVGGDDDATEMVEAMVASLAAKNRATRKKKNITKTLAPLLERLYSGPTTLRALLGDDATRRDCLIPATATVVDAAAVMAATGRAVLATDKNDCLVGIVTPKDVSKSVFGPQNLGETTVETIMTRNPDVVDAAATLLEAMHQMHDGGYLHLPVVVDGDRKQVAGVVDVTELALATMGGNGAEGWSSLVGLDDDDDDDGGGGGAASSERSATLVEEEVHKTVAHLRPDKHPVILDASESISDACAAIASRRTDCAILTRNGRLAGIVTDNDVARKGIATSLDLATTPVEEIMTPNPKVVKSGEPALDALKLMVANKFRHLPVVVDDDHHHQEKEGSSSLSAGKNIVGVLSIHRCLHAAVDKLEKLEEASSASKTDVEALVDTVSKQTPHKKKGDLVHALGPLIETLMGSSAKTLGALLGSSDRRDCLVPHTSTVLDAALVIAATRRAVLATDGDNKLVGILTPKDLLARVVVPGLDPDSSRVEDVMTRAPDVAPPDATLLGALEMMHDRRYLHLPVVDDDHQVLGVVDVMELVYATMGADDGHDGWSTLLAAAADDDQRSEISSVRGDEALAPFDSIFTYKITDDAGHLHRVQASDEHFDELREAIKIRLDCDSDLEITYQDDDGDALILRDDTSLVDAVSHARSSGLGFLKLLATPRVPPRRQLTPPKTKGNQKLTLAITLAALLAVVLVSSMSRR
ncbi:hypothetical protein CTAYLR_003014 [Chrysophaeum taylorii]|uniref:Myosin-like protein n=1 Tax=Chrysophaeum taylorii TaxID=2483200 RepID=A0AAD7U5C2_9STRA|nr:hypothetical protein CTAYLR_003014 [Chrysophaeum taylorii]